MFCSVGAGVSIARRVVDEPKIVLASVVGIGGTVLYLLAAGICLGDFLELELCRQQKCGCPDHQSRREIKRWWCDPATRDMLLGWLLIELWIVAVNLNIRHFAIWIVDWEEHYRRAIYFLQHWPVLSRIYGDFLLPARPPMMNIIESLFMAQSGSGYGDYQMVSGFLNGTLYLSVAGLAAHWSGKRVAGIVAALLALNPWFMQHATYPWTKLYAAFFVLLALWLYRRQFRELAMLMLTAGCLVHYTAIVVAIYVALYDITTHRQEWRRILIAWIACALLMATWVVWALTVFGQKLFVNSTSTALTDAFGSILGPN